VSAHGSGKRTPIDEYPTHHRGGGGVITFKVLDKTGPVAAARMVKESQELIVISQEGIVLRTRVDGISVQGRSTQGVSIIGLAPGDAVASVAVIEMAPEQGAATAEGPAPSEPPKAGAATGKGAPAAAKPAAKAEAKAKAKPQPKAARSAPPKAKTARGAPPGAKAAPGRRPDPAARRSPAPAKPQPKSGSSRNGRPRSNGSAPRRRR
jgi:hypothetical protein